MTFPSQPDPRWAQVSFRLDFFAVCFRATEHRTEHVGGGLRNFRFPYFSW